MNIFKKDDYDNSFWLGPFMACKFDKWHTRREKSFYKKTYCSNKECKNYNPCGEFCERCGNKVIKEDQYYDLPIKPDKDLPKLPKGLELKLWDQDQICGDENDYKEYVILGPGKIGESYRHLCEEEFLPEKIQGVIDEFKNTYADYINKCEKVFGKENVRISWGIFPYYYDW